ncbi:amidohydrolase [Bacillaceae bacterium]
MRTIIVNATIITLNESGDILAGGAIGFSEKGIDYLGETPSDLSGYDQVIDGRHKAVLPGLVNTHGHAAMSLLRGYADDLPLQEWLEEKMWPLEAKFTAEHVKWGTLLSLAEMIRSGTTCFVDMYDHMEEVAQAVETSGIRGVLTRGVIGLCSPEEQRRKLEEAVRFAVSWHGRANGRIRTMMAPHAPYTCPPEYIAKIVAKAEEHDLPVHIHVSETQREVEQNIKDYGVRPVAHLEKLGVFRRPTLVAHAVHLTDEEIEILARYDVKVSHNPGSNLKLASGIARVPQLMRRGVTVSLGTDSAASNNNLDMFEEIRLAALLHKGSSGDPTVVPALEALKMGTVYGARAAFLPPSVGALKVGNAADLITVSLDRPHFQPAGPIVSHLVYSACGNDVCDLFVDGKPIMRERELLTLDEERIMYEANRLRERLRR